MVLLSVTLPEEFSELAKKIDDISKEKHQSISRTIREILCESLDFTPENDIRKRNMYREDSKSEYRKYRRQIQK